MATFTMRGIVRELLDNDGCFPGDPQAARIYEYLDMSGKVVWAVFYRVDHDDMATSPYVERPTLLWDRQLGHVAPIGTLEKDIEREGRALTRDVGAPWDPAILRACKGGE